MFLDNRGCDFRPDYSKLGMLCAIYPDVPVLTMTATVNIKDIKCIIESQSTVHLVIYLPLKWCGFAHKLFESELGSFQYVPKNSLKIPENRWFAQFYHKGDERTNSCSALLFSRHCYSYFCNCCNLDGCGQTIYMASDPYQSTM